MNISKHKFLTYLFLSFFLSAFSNDNYLKTPKEFLNSCQAQYIEKINSGVISLESLDYNFSQRDWIVFSDRSNNILFNSYDGSATLETLSFMQPLYVKKVKGQWLKVYSIDYEELGWIKARNVILTKYSILTNTNDKDKVAIPLKKIIITSIDGLRKDGLTLEEAEKYRNFYSEPSTRKSDVLNSVRDFEIYFVLKEQDGSVLLANNDFLSGTVNTNISLVKGWVPFGNTTPWDTRLMLEPSRSKLSMLKYGNEVLHGFQKEKQLNTYLDTRVYKDSTSFIEFNVGAIPYDRMRKPVLKSINDNIKKVVSITKDTQGDVKNKQELKRMMRKLETQQQHTNIIFVVDATASMTPYFKSVAKSIQKIMAENKRVNKHELQFGVVLYRDYADGNKSWETLKLTSDIQLVTNYLNNVICASKDDDKPEAMFNGIIKGLNDLNIDNEESNIMVLIGDCGNHRNDKFTKQDVADVLDKYNINVISFQVNYDKNDFIPYASFNKEVQDFIMIKSEKIIENRDTDLIPKWERIDGKSNAIELSMVESSDDFVNTFGRFIYSQGTPMDPNDLESQISIRIKEYMNVTDNNLVQLRKGFNPKVDQVPGGLLLYIMDSFDLTKKEALDFLSRNEVTSKAFVAIDYNKGANALEHVVFFSQKDYRVLKKQLNIFRNSENLKSSERKMMFQERLINICENIIGSTSTDTDKKGLEESNEIKNNVIENLQLNEVWQLIFGIDYNAYPKIKTTPLNKIADQPTRLLNDVIDDFENKCSDFCSTDYYNNDEYENRIMTLNGNKFYWIPIEDLPGTKK
ncbi:MAG: hypothetical protein CBC71_01540 [Rhodobacteraceae bacterium TMED111]|nr:MAG: hypothetical protein CBC71_01540 [Rhodobacteraceae bacterium TMED111]|tara:strand:+ start:5633 stop:8035 length:2403 start_codon:yes stop_codon:yes gene_type:complete